MMKNNNFEVSVVIPAFNEEKTIARAIESVFHQTYQPKEIIIINDGSTDNTENIVLDFEKKVTLITKENGGLAAARNTGIKHASSKFIAFLDADDEWVNKHLENSKNIFDVNPDLKWCCSSYERRSEINGTLFIRNLNETFLMSGVIENFFKIEAAFHFALPTVMVIKKSVFDKIGGFDEEISHFGEDIDMWFRIALKYPSIGYSQDVSAIYWERDGSLTNSRLIDLNRFFTRIQRSESAALKQGTMARIDSEPVLLDWLKRAIKESIKQGNKIILLKINKFYGSRLPLKFKFILYFGLFSPNLLVNYLINIKQSANKLLTKG